GYELSTVVLTLAVGLLRPDARGAGAPADLAAAEPVRPAADDVAALADLLAGAARPVIIAGRGARHARAELLSLADACGALLATSAVAKGLFHGRSEERRVGKEGGAESGAEPRI